MKRQVAFWKLLVILGTLLVFTQSVEAHAVQVMLKPGVSGSPTSKELFKVGPVGFQDESYCTVYSDSCSNPTYATAWAFSIKNLSPTKSAANVRAQVTFLGGQGKLLFQEVITVAHELKPGKTTYAAANNIGSGVSGYLGPQNQTGPDSNFSGALSATAKIISESWIAPTKSVVHNSIYLKSTQSTLGDGICSTLLKCLYSDISYKNYMQAVDLSGKYFWNEYGNPNNSGGLLIYLDALGNPMGGWLNSKYPLGTGVQPYFSHGNSFVNIYDFLLTPFEVTHIVKFIYLPTT